LEKSNAKTFIQRLLIDGILNKEINLVEIIDRVIGKKVTQIYGKLSIGVNWPITDVGCVL
jgi:hypothetical protein